ncbi:hypothetical protein BT63DRAFT_419410 [Microthyrium microscopicum]|uniref:Uncharacterized protein n=1 Tax=Microthyrium microscopicum TaxID=703497 RepID=A0A6A6URT6_9PEZI|nr:hypothetical protein BT63DRAFT_419410 [Microthyrium microscopicum]
MAKQAQEMRHGLWCIRFVRTWYGDGTKASKAASDKSVSQFMESIKDELSSVAILEAELLDDATRFEASATETRDHDYLESLTTPPRYIMEALAGVANFQDTLHNRESWVKFAGLSYWDDTTHNWTLDQQPRTKLVILDELACKQQQVLEMHINGKGKVITNLTKDVDLFDFGSADSIPGKLWSGWELEDRIEDIHMLVDLELGEFFMEDCISVGDDETDLPSTPRVHQARNDFFSDTLGQMLKQWGICDLHESKVPRHQVTHEIDWSSYR